MEPATGHMQVSDAQPGMGAELAVILFPATQVEGAALSAPPQHRHNRHRPDHAVAVPDYAHPARRFDHESALVGR